MKSLEDRIITALKKGPLSTSDLALAIHANRSTVYNKCKRMEKQGILASRKKEGEKKLFYCRLTHEVLTDANREKIRALIKIMALIHGSGVKNAKLISRLLQQVLTDENYDDIIVLIQRSGVKDAKLISKLLKRLLTYEDPHDVIALIRGSDVKDAEVKPFYPKIIIWRLKRRKAA
jgi:DNA-binding MarR family transcriptional regulator